MINPSRLQELLPAYSEEAKLFFYSYGLAGLIVDAPVDHVAIKALDRKVYEDYLKLYAPLSERISYQEVDNRDLALAKLITPLDADTLGNVAMLEIMEPRPGAIATTYDLIDHIEFLVPNLAEVESGLKSKDVLYKLQSNENHNTIVIPINEWEQEVKFTDKSLQEIADQALKEGKAKLYLV